MRRRNKCDAQQLAKKIIRDAILHIKKSNLMRIIKEAIATKHNANQKFGKGWMTVQKIIAICDKNVQKY